MMFHSFAICFKAYSRLSFPSENWMMIQIMAQPGCVHPRADQNFSTSCTFGLVPQALPGAAKPS
jgi:hypothetical protein